MDKGNETMILKEPIKPKQVRIRFWNYLSVGWLTPLLWQGARKPLTAEQLYELPEGHKSRNLDKYLMDYWLNFRKYSSDRSQKPPSLFVTLVKKYWHLLLLNLILNCLYVACLLVIPTFLKQVILYLTPLYPKSLLIVDSGAALAVILALLQIGTFLFQQTAMQVSVTLQIDWKTILIGAVYEKSLKLSQKSMQTFTSGQILNIINVDIEKVSLAFVQASQLITAPIQIIVSIILLGDLIGYAVWAGAGSLLGILAFQVFLIGFLVIVQKKFLAQGDKRLKSLREVLYGIKIIKFRSLENFFYDRIQKIRDQQMAYLSKYYLVQTFFVGFIQIAPISMPISAFLTYAAINGSITPSIIFPALSLFQGLFQPVITVPQSITAFAVAVVSWNRISDFLLCDEAIENEKPAHPAVSVNEIESSNNIAISASNLSFKWEHVKSTKESSPGENAKVHEKLADGDTKANNDAFNLTDLTFNIQKGAKIAIVGAVGAGKSSILSGMIGEMTKTGGNLIIQGKVAYCAQQPWILTDTVKGNIVFNQDLDIDRLETVLKACGLKRDIDGFPAGLETEIGEKGVNLSGGQKARIALARAMYFNPDILLLDDPISALDVHVGRHVFDNAIKTFLSDKTVLLVTHQLQLLPEMDYILVMSNSTIKEQGTYKELISDSKSILSGLMKDHKPDDQRPAFQKDAVVETIVKGEGGIQVAEDQAQGNVSLDVYKDYFHRCGGILFHLVVIFSAVLNSGTQVLNSIILQWWSSNKYNLSQNTYMLYYGVSGVVQFAFALMINAVFLTGGFRYDSITRATKYYHPRALWKLLRAPMGFFDSQPIGRILNRFSKDVESIDQNLWIMLFLTTIAIAGSLSSLAFLCYVDQRMIILAIPLLILYFFMLKYFQRSNIELKRFEATNKSPLYAHVSETLGGIATLKAFGVEMSFVSKQRDLMDYSNGPSFLRLMAGVWMSLRLGIISASITFLLAILGTTSAIEASLVGLALVYALAFANSLGLLLFSSTQLENEFNAVERLQYYCKELPEEAEMTLPTDVPADQWPTEGRILLTNISLAYPSNPDNLILKDLSVEFKAGENVGVVGRTGSGKSTLMNALFRIIELKGGKIEIDGKDISNLGLSTLRKAMQIIPQEPVLFSGNIRQNMDVEGLYDDESIWSSLERVGLKKFVESLPEKLDAPVVENGDNLSVGQRQLVCLGRAILCRPKILIMDEATASVDAEADLKIQESIKLYFQDTTVISIAHRLNTISDFDRVLVLADGRKEEFDSPHNLLENPASLFCQLAEATGKSNFEVLRAAAAKRFQMNLNKS